MQPPLPPIGICQVVAQNPPFGVYVIFRSTGQGTQFPVRMMYDYADGLRVHQKPLPGIGTWGVVVIPNGDIRCAIWLGAYLPSQVDALTSDGSQTAAFIENRAHFSGDLEYLDGLGNYARQFADGSYIISASGQSLPTVYRHLVESNQQQAVAFTRADRIPNPPSVFYMHLHHQSGTDVLIDPSGNITVSGATGSQIEFVFGAATLKIDQNGHATLSLPGSETFDVTQGGAPASDFAALVSKIVTAWNAHTHSGVAAGGANTGTPTSPISSTTINSVAVKLSG